MMLSPKEERRRARRRGIYVRGPYVRVAPPAPCKDPSGLFWEKVDKNGPKVPGVLGCCWIWTGGRDKDGYGKFQVSVPGEDKQRHIRAHRFAWEEVNGPVPADFYLLHRCDNPACVRPGHLRPGTQKQNREDCVRRGREPRGSKKPNAIFTEELIRSVRDRVASGAVLADIARELKVNYLSLHNAVTKNWRHV